MSETGEAKASGSPSSGSGTVQRRRVSRRRGSNRGDAPTSPSGGAAADDDLDATGAAAARATGATNSSEDGADDDIDDTAGGVRVVSKDAAANADDNDDDDESSGASDDNTLQGGTTDNEDEDETDVNVWKRRFEKQRAKWLAATVTIQSLIEQFTDYKHTVDEDKVLYEERLASADKQIRQEKAKNARTNQETIANLKTLMLELEMIENKNQELHEELQQERLEHERSLAQLAEARAARDDLEQDVQELTRELKQTKESATTQKNLTALLSVRSGGSRVGTMRPTRPGMTPSRPGGVQSSANRFSTMRVDAGVVDLSAEVRALKQQKVELREQLEAETKKHLEVTALLNQLNIIMGIHMAAPTMPPPTARSGVSVPTISLPPAAALTPVRGHDTQPSPRTPTKPDDGKAAAPAAASTPAAPTATLPVTPASAVPPHLSAGSVIYRRAPGVLAQMRTPLPQGDGGGGGGVPATPSESAALRLREAITKISANEPTLTIGSMSARHQHYVCEDPAYETQLAGVSGRVTALLQVGTSVWIGCGNGQIDIYAGDTHARLSTIQARSSAISQLVVAGEHVWLAATDGGVSIYSFGGALVETLAAHSAKVMGIVAVEKCAWTCGADMTIRVWHNTPPFRCRKEVQLQNLMLSVIYHLGIVWIGTESVISRWNAQTFRHLDSLDRKGKSMHCVNALVSVDDKVWSLSGDNVIAVWSALGEQLKSIEVAQRMLGLFACGRTVWISSTSSAHVYDIDATPIRQIRRPHSDSMRAAVLISVDGRERVWSGASDRTVVIWRLPKKTDVLPASLTDAPLAADTLRSATPTTPLLSAVDPNSLDTETVLLALKDPLLGLRIQTKKIGFGRSKPNAFTARELVDWILTSLPQIERRPDAVLLARRLHSEGHLQSAQGDEIFRDGNRVWQYGAGFRFIMPEAEQKKLQQTSQRAKDPTVKPSPTSTSSAGSKSDSSSSKPAAPSSAGSKSDAASKPAADAAAASDRPTRGESKSDKKSTGTSGTKKKTHKTVKPDSKAPAPPAIQQQASDVSSSSDSKRSKTRKDRRDTVALDASPVAVAEMPSRLSSASGSPGGSRRIRTTGSQLMRHVSRASVTGASGLGGNVSSASDAAAGAATADDAVSIEVLLGADGKKKHTFAVPSSWTLATFKTAIERVWGVQPTYSLYVMKPNSDEVIGLMTPELNPRETVVQLRDEKVECVWQWRETRSEDWEQDDDALDEVKSE